MLRKKAGCSGSAPIDVKIFVAARDFLGTAAREAADCLSGLSYETIKITAVGNGAYVHLEQIQRIRLQIRSIRITFVIVASSSRTSRHVEFPRDPIWVLERDVILVESLVVLGACVLDSGCGERICDALQLRR